MYKRQVKMFSIWLNSAFVKDSLVVFEKSECDGAGEFSLVLRTVCVCVCVCVL